MGFIDNLDLLFVGIAVSGIALIGFATFFNNLRSVTGQTFLFFAAVAILWNITNYLTLTLANPVYVLWNLRAELFFATWYSFGLFQLFYVFPKEKKSFTKFYKFVVVPFVSLVSLITLTPLTFSGITKFSFTNKVLELSNGPGIVIFGMTVVTLILSGLFIFIKKLRRSSGELRKQMILVLVGFSTTFFLHLIFNFILPAFFNNSSFIEFGAVYTFPTVALTAYAIVEHKLFDIRALSIGIITFFLSVVSITGVIFANSFVTLLFNTSEFILVIIFSIWLIRSVTKEVQQREKIEKLAKDLEKANTRLKALDRQKSEFVSIASHQLRSPITAIRGYASLIVEGDYGKLPEKLKEPLKRISESARLMTLSIEDYLNISRIEQGRMKYEMSDFDIRDLAQKVVDEYVPVAQDKNLDLSYISKKEPILIHADIGKIKQVLANLVDNSIKYTPEGKVTVSVEETKNNRVQIIVQDTGVGIPKDDLGGLFSKFVRARGANKINTSGTGLGLYVAKQMVEAHKGKIWAESKGKGTGSKFIVELPLKKG